MSSDANDINDHFQLLGTVEALATTFKTGSAQVVLNVVLTVWQDTAALVESSNAGRSALLRKYLVKLAQQIGLMCLPHISQSWRYMGRKQTLGDRERETSKDLTRIDKNNETAIRDPSELFQEEDMDVPEMVEEIIDVLLSALRDTNSLCNHVSLGILFPKCAGHRRVHWSAAKGIGRVTSRLTYALSDEVPSSVPELFSPIQSMTLIFFCSLVLSSLVKDASLRSRETFQFPWVNTEHVLYLLGL
ncbi:hypothetical protein DM860_004536 [Cuscuta australis]|uniref:Tubulin-folding cofactor D ARM repeats domain-containing protein n=1 Tax=Cuscuta australis TaxID=267555 RepID=A0A328E7P5_9ASTE|nr:hypothetical protein DM860_004536 [Cuscuta australis]